MPRRTLLIIALALLAPVAALAHGVLKSSVPAKDARLSVVPTELRLTFTEPVELAVAALELSGPGSSGSPVVLSALRHAGDSTQVVVADIQGPMTEGVYTVAWRITGRDGHPVRGTFAFTVNAGATGIATAATSATPAPGHEHVAADDAGTAKADSGMTHATPGTQPQPDEPFGTGSPLFVFARALTFAGLLGVLGAVVFRALILARAARAGGAGALIERTSSRVLTTGILAAAVLVVAGVLRLYAQAYATHGAQGALDPALLITMVTKTTWGWGWLLQIAATALVLIGFVIARRGSTGGSAVAMLGALALAVSPALSGHAVGAPERAWLAVPNDVLHVIGAGGWMGSLLMLVAVGIPVAMSLDREVRGRAVSVLVNAFSPIALTFATLAAATGIISAWLHLGSFGALWSSDYGWILSIKLLVLLPVVALGAFNWLRVRPSLGDDTGANRIRRSATAELAIGALVVVVTAVLVATPPAAR